MGSELMLYPEVQTANWPQKDSQGESVSTARHIGVVHSRVQATVTTGDVQPPRT